MRILNVQQLNDAPRADLYLCVAERFNQATPSKRQVELFLKLVPDGVVTLYRAVDPNTVTISGDVAVMNNNAAAMLQGLGWAYNPKTCQWSEPPKPAVAFDIKHTDNEGKPIIPKHPSTWPLWEHAERRDCAICGDRRVSTVHDPDGVPRCASCWEDLQPCVNCGQVSTRPGGEHYCHKPGPCAEGHLYENGVCRRCNYINPQKPTEGNQP